MTTPYEYAKGYAENGFCVIPIRLWYPNKDGSKPKQPAISAVTPYQTIKPTEDEMRQWWDRSNPPGLAILHGSISGFSEMLEAERQEDLEEFKQRLESHGLSHIFEKLTLQVASPGGGVHFIYRCPELGSLEATPGSERLAARYLLDDAGNRIPNRSTKTGAITNGSQIKPKIETRARGGYAIVPGSPLEVHPARKPYALIGGFFDAVPVITLEERKSLFDIARLCDAIDEEPKREKTSAHTPDSQHSGEVRKMPHPYSVHATTGMVLDLLEGMGATTAKYKDYYIVARPGKTLKEGLSGTVDYRGGAGFHVFTSSWEGFNQGQTYSPFSVYGKAKHGGDFKAASRDLGLQGYGFHPGWEMPKDFTTRQNPKGDLDIDSPLESIPDLTTQSLTDTGNAERLVALYGSDIRFCPGVGWMVWNEKHWIRQDKDNLQLSFLVGETMRETLDQAGMLFSKINKNASPEELQAEQKRITKLADFARTSLNAPRIRFAIEVAKSLPQVYAAPSLFDPKGWLIPFQNGVWNKGVWQEGHDREMYIEHLLPVDYDSEADRREWNALLERITGGDKDLELSLGELAATVLVASPLRKITIFYGESGTGKSTLSDMLLTVLGNCGEVVESASLADQKDDSRLGAKLRGKRGLFTAEAGARPLDTELLKKLAGGDPMACRLLFTDCNLKIAPTWNTIMTSNDAPRINAHDAALRDRIVAVPFLHRLDAGQHLIFAGHQRIEGARKDVSSPLIRGFVPWLMDGLIRLYGQDLHNAYLAPVVSQHTAKLFRDADPLTDFWEWYEIEYEGSLERGVQSSELERIYISWCETQKIRYVKRGKAFAKACEAKELESKKTSRGNHWRKQWRNGGKGPVGESSREAIILGDFPEKAPFLHSSTISLNEDDLVEEEVDLPIDGEGL